MLKLVVAVWFLVLVAPHLQGPLGSGETGKALLKGAGPVRAPQRALPRRDPSSRALGMVAGEQRATAAGAAGRTPSTAPIRLRGRPIRIRRWQATPDSGLALKEWPAGGPSPQAAAEAEGGANTQKRQGAWHGGRGSWRRPQHNFDLVVGGVWITRSVGLQGPYADFTAGYGEAQARQRGVVECGAAGDGIAADVVAIDAKLRQAGNGGAFAL